MKMRIYFGCALEEDRNIYTVVTGEMTNGTLVYTECETKNGAVISENGMPKLILNNQYTRHLKKGFQTFERL